MTSEPRTVRLAHVQPVTEAEGPGRRFAVWVQGCSIRCRDCFNPHMWSASGGRPVPVSELVEQAGTADVEGVTLLGGEPFEQAGALAELAEGVRARGLSVMTFTGFRLEDLRARADAGDRGAGRLLDATDLLVDGPYDATRPDLVRPWVGSTDQRFRFLTPRYAHLEPRLTALPDRLEVRVAADGEISVNGWASTDDLDALLEGMGRRPRPPRRGNRTGR